MIEFIQPSDFIESQRLFHGRGHAYPELSHVNVDWLEPVILITLYQEVEPSWLAEQVELLKALTDKCHSIQVQYRCRKFAPCELLWGEEVANLHALEHNLKYHISLGKAQNSGLFLDMRNGREWVKNHSDNKTITNTIKKNSRDNIKGNIGFEFLKRSGHTFAVNYERFQSLDNSAHTDSLLFKFGKQKNENTNFNVIYDPLKNNNTEISYLKKHDNFDLKVKSNYAMYNKISDYGAGIELSATF